MDGNKGSQMEHTKKYFEKCFTTWGKWLLDQKNIMLAVIGCFNEKTLKYTFKYTLSQGSQTQTGSRAALD